jgi:hypothetical protein
MRRVLTAVLALLAAGAATAQEVSAYAGVLRVNSTHEQTFSAEAGYSHPVDEHLALSLSYLNEGHPTDHHRDGVAAQAWLRTGANEPGWTFGLGAGPYFYFDTARLHNAGVTTYHNDHGWATIYSLLATYHYPGSRWYNQVQLNRISPTDKEATTSLMVGVGYQFNGVRGDKLHLEAPAHDEALTVMAGQGINNSLNSERSRIGAVEYRQQMGRYVDWTVTALDEGHTPQSRRNGVATQLWLIRSLTPKTELGMGFGPYLSLEVPDAPGYRSHVAGLISVASRYHWSRHVVGELSWSRVATDYHRDADLLLIGLGYSY